MTSRQNEPMDPRRISVVVPVYNSETTLDELVARLVRVLEPMVADFEIVLVNDGSRDGSAAVLERLAQRDRRVRPIALMRNYGQHNALLCGIRTARYELIVTLDDDLQNPPEEIPRLLARLDGFDESDRSGGSDRLGRSGRSGRSAGLDSWGSPARSGGSGTSDRSDRSERSAGLDSSGEGDRGEVDVVYGAAQERHHERWRNWASSLTRLALRSAIGADTARWVSPYRLFRTSLREAFSAYESSFVSIDVLLTWGTTKFAAVPVAHDARRAGKSSYTFRALLVLALNMATGFSTLPLQVASLLGFAATLLGIALLGFVLTRYMAQGSQVPGFPFLASIILIFSGTQLFALGIIGEYLSRMHFRTLGRPAYARRPAVDPSRHAEAQAQTHADAHAVAPVRAADLSLGLGSNLETGAGDRTGYAEATSGVSATPGVGARSSVSTATGKAMTPGAGVTPGAAMASAADATPGAWRGPKA